MENQKQEKPMQHPDANKSEPLQIVDHEHLSYEEIKHFYDLEPGYLSSSDSRLTQKIHEALDSCSICRQRYQFYIDTDAAFTIFSPDEDTSEGTLSEVGYEPSHTEGLVLDLHKANREILKKMIDSMNDDTAVQHEHISFEDIERVNSLYEYPSDADWGLFLKVHEMVDDCSVCRRRFKLYINLRSTFAAFSPEKHSLKRKKRHTDSSNDRSTKNS